MAAPRSRRCSLSLLTLFSISLILISLSLFFYTKPSNKPYIDYTDQFSVSSPPPLLSPLLQINTTNTLVYVSSPPPLMSPFGQSNTANTIISVSSPPPLSSSSSDQQDQNKPVSPTQPKVIKVCIHSSSFFCFPLAYTNLFFFLKFSTSMKSLPFIFF